MINLLALIGPKQSGKTTLANLLKDHGWQTTSFSTPIKRMLGTLLLDQGVNGKDVTQILYGDQKETPTPFLNYKTPRHAMQTLGSEWRDLIHKDLWIDIWLRTIDLKNEKIIVDDVRFIHEANRIKSLGGKLIKISRLEIENFDPHSSEQELNKIIPDFVIYNDSVPEYMFYQLKTKLGEDL